MCIRDRYLAISADRNKILFFLFFGIYAGMAIPLFTLNLAYVNDYMEKAKFVSAGAGMQIIFGLGAMMGPFLCSTLMSAFGTNGFFIYLLIFHFLLLIIHTLFDLHFDVAYRYQLSIEQNFQFQDG